jgi:predicted lipoprotein with Yx(FWY)xxD motif
MKTILWIIVAIIVIVGGLFIWSAAMAPTVPVATSATQNATTTVPNSIIGSNLALSTGTSSTLGMFLIGYNGMPVYTSASDTAGTSTCYGQCATQWPPYVVSSSDDINNLQTGVTGTVGTITRTDGTLQLTYNGMPLYFFMDDTPSNPPTGQGVSGFSVAKP